MKAILEFNLDDIDDRLAHLRAIKSLELVFVLNDVLNKLRAKIKYGNLTDEEYKIYEKVREMISKIMDNYSINIKDLLL